MCEGCASIVGAGVLCVCKCMCITLASTVIELVVCDCNCLACRSKQPSYTKMRNQFEELALQAEMKQESSYKGELDKQAGNMDGVVKLLRRLELKLKMEKDHTLHV